MLCLVFLISDVCYDHDVPSSELCISMSCFFKLIIELIRSNIYPDYMSRYKAVTNSADCVHGDQPESCFTADRLQ